MEGHGGLPSAADVQGKSLPQAPWAISVARPHARWLYLLCSHKISTLCLVAPTPAK